MKIWLNPSTALEEHNNDCPTPATLSNKSISAPFKTVRLRHAQNIYIQQCQDERWLVCNPVGSGRIAVLDADALLLLNMFASPTTLQQVCSLISWPYEVLDEVVTLFYISGFLLQDSMSHFPEHLWEEVRKLTVWIHVSNQCNLRCHYCYLDKTPEHMAGAPARKSIDAIFRSATKHKINSIKLKYAGGEASLHMTSVVALHDYATQLGREYDITLEAAILSNGVLLSQRTIDYLKSRYIQVMISLDGLEAYHDSQRPFVNGRGSFRYIFRTIDRLLTNSLIPHISVTVSRLNLGGLPDLMGFILDHEMPFTLSYYRENACSAHMSDLRFQEEELINAMGSVFSIIEQRLPRRSLLGCLTDKVNPSAPHAHTCGVGHNYLVIDQHGMVAKCQADIKSVITAVDTDDPLQVIRTDRDGVQGLPVDEKEGCRECDWRYWCTGGCPLLTYRATGRFDVKSPNCNIYKALFPGILRLEALRLLRYEEPIALEEVRKSLSL